MANTLTFANLTLTDANLFGGVSFLADLNTGEEFSIGNTASASVSFVSDTQLPLYTKDATNGKFTWTQDSTSRGRYFITKVTKEAGRYNVTAYDAMYLLETNISALSLTFPLTVSAAASAIAAYIGCTVSGTVTNGSLSVSALDDDMTIRELLGYVAEASGCSVKIDGSDHLCFMYYADSGITITDSQYKEFGLEVADYTCAAIDNVTIINNEGEIQASAGSGTNTLYIGQNPFLEEATSTHATAIYNAVKDFEYAPLTVSMFEEYGIEVGTIATFGFTPTLVMHLESSEEGAVASSVGSDSRAEYNKDITVTINETREIAIDAQTVAGQAQSAASAASSAAASASSQASAAYSLAESAQTSANGKNKIYRQASQPSGGTYVTGDIWFDTANDNKIYRYNGSSWVGFTLGDDAIGNLNASHINAGTIDASVVTVSNLDAGNITTGTIDADRIDASTLTINNSGLATIADISNENLLIDSQTMDAWGLGSQASLDTSGEFGVITMTPSADNTWNATFNSRPTLDTSILNGKTMWLSFEYTLSAASSVAITINGASQAVGSMTVTRTKYLSKYVAYDATSSWKKAVVAMPTSVSQLTSGSGDVNSLYVSIFNYQHANTVMKVRKLKLEHGVSASDWTPSAEDYKAYITRIDGAGIRIHPATTENNSVVINANGMEIFKGGTTSAYSVAKYGESARIGKTDSSHIDITPTGSSAGIKFSDNTNTLAEFALDTTDTGHTTDGWPMAAWFTLGYRAGQKGYYSLAGGYNCISSGAASVSYGIDCNAYGDTSVAMGGQSVTGRSGQSSTAYGWRSVALGSEVVAASNNQVAVGCKNIIDNDGNYVFIVGNGGGSTRKNALTVDWSGNLTLAGHSSAVGTIKEAYPTSAVSVASGTAKALTSISLEAGTWVVTCGVRSPSNSTGYRMANLSTTSGASDNNVSQPAANGISTQLRFVQILTLTATTTYYLNAYHTAGTTLSYPAGGSGHTNFIRAVRIV